MENHTSMFSRQQQKTLLHIARETIKAGTLGAERPQFEIRDQALNRSMGAFVTLHRKGELAGCIGNIEGRGALWKTIQEMAEAAAFRDPRFPAVRTDQVDQLQIEISALSPLRKIDDIEEIEVGKHGLYITSSYASGLLLPQVATERNWDRLTFLQHTCIKAGLPGDAWKKPDTSIYVFSADIFSESQVE